MYTRTHKRNAQLVKKSRTGENSKNTTTQRENLSFQLH